MSRLDELERSKTAASVDGEILNYFQAYAYFNAAGTEQVQPTVKVAGRTVFVTSYTDSGGVQFSQFNGLQLKLGGVNGPVAYTLPLGQGDINPGTYTLRVLGTITGDTGNERLYGVLNYT